MKTPALVRTAGITMIPAAAVTMLGMLAQSAKTYQEAGGIAEMAGGTVLVLALPALTVRMATAAGRLGFAGTLLITFVVIDFQIVGGAMGAFVIPTLAAQGSPTEPPPALGIVFMLGMLAQLLGSAFIAYTTLRRRPVPVAVGWLWAASLLVEIASMVPGAGFLDALSGVLAMSALIVSGASLAGAGRRDAATHPSPTAAKA